MDAYTKRMLKRAAEIELHGDPDLRGRGSHTTLVGDRIVNSIEDRSAAARGEGKTANNTYLIKDPFPDLPPLRRRSPAERAESLAQRLWTSVKDHDPAQTEFILKLLYQDSWKRGQPVSYDEVKQVAVNLMRTAAAKAGASY